MIFRGISVTDPITERLGEVEGLQSARISLLACALAAEKEVPKAKKKIHTRNRDSYHLTRESSSMSYILSLIDNNNRKELTQS